MPREPHDIGEIAATVLRYSAASMRRLSNLSTSIFSRLLSDERLCAAERTCDKAEPVSGRAKLHIGDVRRRRLGSNRDRTIPSAPDLGYCQDQRAASTFWFCVGPSFRQRRAAAISASVAPWLRAHSSAVDAEYFAT